MNNAADAQETSEQLESRLNSEIREEFEKKFEIWKTQELASMREEESSKITGLVKEYMEDFKKDQKPLTLEEIQVLVNQEYLSLEIKVKPYKCEVPKIFTLCELPQISEQQFYKSFKEQLVDKASDLASLTQETMDVPLEEKIRAGLRLLDNGFDILADSVTLCLNPFNEDKEITRDWVQHNISSARQWNIAKAQLEIQRLRDFFSNVSRAGLKTQTLVSPVDTRQLQQLFPK